MIETSNITSEKRLEFVDKHLNQKRSVKLKTCADVYGHWRAYKRTYKKAPTDGVEFQIDYIDTGLALDEQARSQAPIALALHGAPGSYHDFALLIQHLSQQKVRVIAPNFPEYVATVKTKVLFRHSADEKAAYLRDFLKAIKVNKIDLLVSHSSAIFPTLLILLNGNNEAIARQKFQVQQLADKDQLRKVATKQQQQVSTIKGSRSTIDDRQGNECVQVGAGGAFEESSSENIQQQDLKRDCQDQHHHLTGNSNNNNNKNNHSKKNLNGNDDDESFEDASDEIELDGNNNNEKLTLEKSTALVDEDYNNKATITKMESDEKISSEGNGTEQLVLSDGAKLIDSSSLKRESNGQQRLLVDSCNTKTKRKGNKRSDVIVKFEQPIEIKAVALLNPAGHRLPKSMKPTWFKCGSVHVYQHKFGRSLFRKFGPAFLTVVGVPVRVDNMDNVMLSATVMRNSKCQRVSKQLEQLSEMKIPTLLVFSENDKLIEKEIFYEMTQFMKLNPRNFDVFNNDGDIELSQSDMEDWIRVMVFKTGGHYAYSNYAKTVNQAVSELLEKVRNRTSIRN